MPELASLLVKIDASSAIRETEKLNTALGKTEQQSTKVGLAVKAMGLAVGVAAVGGFRKLISETSEADAVQAQLRAGLLSTGAASRQTLASLNAHAGALQRLTTFSDEAVGSAQSLLLTFTKIGGDTFPAATRAVADMAARMGGDLRGAALQVGKALNDPVEGLGALSRAGVQFSASQKSAIERMVEMNDVAGAQRIILAELETQFGGSAAAARNTLGGAITGLRNQIGELFEMNPSQSSSLVRDVNRLEDAFRGLGGSLATIDRWAFRLGITDVNPNGATPPADSSLAPRTSGNAAAITITAAQTEREKWRAGWEEARTKAAERAKWEDEAILRAVRLGDARFRAENPGGPAAPGASTTRLGWAESMRGIVTGAGVTSLPKSMRLGPGLSTAQGASVAAAEQALAWKQAMEKRNEEIASNYLENMQRSTAGFIGELASGGRVAMSDVWQTFRRIGGQAIGETISSALARMGGGKAGGGFLGTLGTVLGVGSIVTGFLGSRRASSPREEPFHRMSAGQLEEWERLRAVEQASIDQRNGVGNQIRQSVGGLLNQSSAMRIVGELTSIRIASTRTADGVAQLVARAGGVTVNVSASDGASPGQSVAELVDRAMGIKTQQLRLASGAAVVG